MISSKDARETRRAIADAILLLRQADDVMLLTVREGGRPAGIAETIVDAAVGHEADVIVARGYGHSRFREQTFESGTEYLLRHYPLHL